MLKKRDDLSADYVRSILTYDSQTGFFLWKHRPDMPLNWNNRRAGTKAGFDLHGYVYVRLGAKQYAAHRLAWLYAYGEWPLGDLDHINGEKSDNRVENLRPANRSENCCNKRRMCTNTTGHSGVYLVDGAFRVMVRRKGAKRFDKRFQTLAEAIDARDAALNNLHGEFAVTQRPIRFDVG